MRERVTETERQRERERERRSSPPPDKEYVNNDSQKTSAGWVDT